MSAEAILWAVFAYVNFTTACTAIVVVLVLWLRAYQWFDAYDAQRRRALVFRMKLDMVGRRA